jgi:hypothetical protein
VGDTGADDEEESGDGEDKGELGSKAHFCCSLREGRGLQCHRAQARCLIGCRGKLRSRDASFLFDW